jgi:hypothetical protein
MQLAVSTRGLAVCVDSSRGGKALRPNLLRNLEPPVKTTAGPLDAFRGGAMISLAAFVVACGATGGADGVLPRRRRAGGRARAEASRDSL